MKEHMYRLLDICISGICNNQYVHVKGDILVNPHSGKIYLVNSDDSIDISRYHFFIRCNQSIVLPAYLAQVLSSNKHRLRVKRILRDCVLPLQIYKRYMSTKIRIPIDIEIQALLAWLSDELDKEFDKTQPDISRNIFKTE